MLRGAALAIEIEREVNNLMSWMKSNAFSPVSMAMNEWDMRNAIQESFLRLSNKITHETKLTDTWASTKECDNGKQINTQSRSSKTD